jgi:predicted DNA-binding protein (MmcQ/YjbR family)
MMDIRKVRALCEARPGATVDHPWGPEERVYKVGGKAFVFLPESPPWAMSVKCDPELVRILRQRYPDAVTVPRYLNKQLWNKVDLGGAVPDAEIEEMIAHSYELVAAKLPKSVRESLDPPGAKPAPEPASRPGGKAKIGISSIRRKGFSVQV